MVLSCRRFLLGCFSLFVFSVFLSAQKRPPLLPLPLHVEWGRDSVRIGALPVHEIVSHSIDGMEDEGYELEVSTSGITLKATSKKGLFYAHKTLKQLALHEYVPTVKIRDTPAFSWRGYMVDVGRNYQSMRMLKEQIDFMSDVKLNVFHFHLTENVAWRLAVDRYPQLTDQEYMTRDKGLFYDERDIRELKKYCEDRHILFLMEIDMPGHSEAFQRAMGYDMQSPEGLEAVLHILDEIVDKYDLRILHIGADEVRITNPDFLPTVINYLKGRGITVMGWHPGGDRYPDDVIHHLWSSDDATRAGDVQRPYPRVDSRNLYINHMDALESVPSVYNHQICDVDAGNETTNLGAILCLWNDRRLRRGEDNLTHNPVYPSLMAFAERSWVGGGRGDNFIGIDLETREKFASFERRMMSLYHSSYSDLPFPYVAQANIEWDIYGPYDNGGDMTIKFAPELGEKVQSVGKVVGGTIIWRHFWDPTVRGLMCETRENTTYYASREVYSDKEQELPMWIGFYDYSRSHHIDSPTAGTWGWNVSGAKIWVNGDEVSPPNWERAGQKGSLEIPFEDENYYMRSPVMVRLRKGTNTILVKSPIGKFNSGIWFAPNKWMFTAVFTNAL